MNSAGPNSASSSFTTLGNPPTVTNLAATDISLTGAKLHATVNPQNQVTMGHFEYGPDPTLTNVATTIITGDMNLGSGSAGVPLDLIVGGLQPLTPYYFRGVAMNATGTTKGAPILSFSTAAPAPTVVTQPPTGVTMTEADFHGTVNPNGTATTARFEYSTDDFNTKVMTALQTIGSGTTAMAINEHVIGLTKGTAYKVRAVASSTVGTTLGNEVAFSTVGSIPMVTTLPATGVTDKGATLHGTVNPKGQTTMAHFLYGTDASLAGAASTADVTYAASGSTAMALDQSVPVLLSPRTKYYFRTFASNVNGPADPPPILNFTTNAEVDEVVDTETTVPGQPIGTTFMEFGQPTVDAGVVGGAAKFTDENGVVTSFIYGNGGSVVLAQTGGDAESGTETFVKLGDPVFGGGLVSRAGETQAVTPGEALGFSGASLPKSGGSKRKGLYSQQTAAGGIHRIATVGGSVGDSVMGATFESFPGFGLPRHRPGLVFAGQLTIAGLIDLTNNFGIWREKADGSGLELLLRTKSPVSPSDPRKIKRLTLLNTVPNASDQRRSFAPDGGVGAAVKLEGAVGGIVLVPADGPAVVPLDTTMTMLPGGLPASARFAKFDPPGTGNGGKYAVRAELTSTDATVVPAEAIFADLTGTKELLVKAGDDVPLPNATGITFKKFGQPLVGQAGAVGYLAKLAGSGVSVTNRQAIMLHSAGQPKRAVARLGEPAPSVAGQMEGTFERFLSLVVTDEPNAHLVFSATLVVDGTVTAAKNMGIWSVDLAGNVTRLLRTGQEIAVGNSTLTVRTFRALDAPEGRGGQGRSTDGDGFVTAFVTLAHAGGRSGVLRIPLP